MHDLHKHMVKRTNVFDEAVKQKLIAAGVTQQDILAADAEQRLFQMLNDMELTRRVLNNCEDATRLLQTPFQPPVGYLEEHNTNEEVIQYLYQAAADNRKQFIALRNKARELKK